MCKIHAKANFLRFRHSYIASAYRKLYTESQLNPSCLLSKCRNAVMLQGLLPSAGRVASPCFLTAQSYCYTDRYQMQHARIPLQETKSVEASSIGRRHTNASERKTRPVFHPSVSSRINRGENLVEMAPSSEPTEMDESACQPWPRCARKARER